MGKLLRTPEGFLDLTGQRVGGVYPTEISDVVAPTLDLFPLGAARLISAESAQSLTSNLGDKVTITVPDNENWLLFQAAIKKLITGTNAKTYMEVGLENLPGSSDPVNNIYIGGEVNYAGAGLTSPFTRVSTWHFPNCIACPPGSDIYAEVIETSVATTVWQLKLGIYKLVGN